MILLLVFQSGDIMKRKLCILVALCSALFSFTLSGVDKTPQTYNKAGYEYLEQGEPFKAITQFQSALRKNPAYKESLVGISRAYLSLDEYREALGYFNKILKLDAENIEAMTGIGFCEIGFGRYDSALEQFTAVLKKSEGNIDAHYGTARLYYIMNKPLWARRKISTIFKLNPFHYKTLLLAAELKSAEGRFSEAEDFIKKALDERPRDPEAYVKYAQLLNAEFIRKGDTGMLSDALENIRRALALRSDNFSALNTLGYLYINERNYKGALDAFERARRLDEANPVLLYNAGLAHEKAGDAETAAAQYEQAIRKRSDDEFIVARLENFAGSGAFKVGHPLRVNLAEKRYKNFIRRRKDHLNDEYLYDLRSAIFLNPLLKEAREELMRYNQDEGYDNLYISELKNLIKIFPDGDYNEELSVAIMKRRNRVYHLAGYSLEEPPRDVPRVMVLDFVSPGGITVHPEAGEIIADSVSFALGQFGRMETIPFAERREIMTKLDGRQYYPMDELLTRLSDLSRDQKINADYVIYGEFIERGDALLLEYKLMNLKGGVVISEDSLYDREAGKLARSSLRIARRVYDKIPYKGRLLKIDDNSIIVNIGSYDGLKAGDEIYINDERDVGVKGKYTIKKKILFKIDSADTVISKATVADPEEMYRVRDEAEVFPLLKRRAVMVK